MNVSVPFKYKDTKITIQCHSDDRMFNICKKFATKIDADVNSKVYIYNANILNLDLTFGQIQNTNDPEEEVKVFDNKDLVKIKYQYYGEHKEFQLPR